MLLSESSLSSFIGASEQLAEAIRAKPVISDAELLWLRAFDAVKEQTVLSEEIQYYFIIGHYSGLVVGVTNAVFDVYKSDRHDTFVKCTEAEAELYLSALDDGETSLPSDWKERRRYKVDKALKLV